MNPLPTRAETLPASGWLTAEEAAAYLKVKPRTLLLWVRQGKVKGCLVGHQASCLALSAR